MARFNDPDDLIQSIFHSCGSSGPPRNRVLAGKKYREPVLLGEKGKEQGFYGFGADLLCPLCGGRFDFILIELENSPDDTPLSWGEIVSALEQVRGEKWEDFSPRYGDWGRDAALWFGRRQGRLSLARLGEVVGGMDYSAVSVAARRFGRRIAADKALRSKVEEMERQLSNVEM